MFENILEILKAKSLLERNGYIVSEKLPDGFSKCNTCGKVVTGLHYCSGKSIENEKIYTQN